MTKRIPKIGTVIPTYEKPKDRFIENNFVLEAISSVLKQSLPINDISIVIDGKSNYIKTKIRKTFSKQKSKIKITETIQKKGGATARNIGFDNLDPKDKFVAFLDDDDKWYPKKLEKEVAVAQKQKQDNYFVFTQTRYDKKAGPKVLPKNYLSPNGNPAEFIFLHNGFITTSSLLIPKKLFNNIRFTDGLKKHQDWDLILRANFFHHVHMIQISLPLTWYREQYEGRQKSVSTLVDWRFSLFWIRKFKKYLNEKVVEAFERTQVIPGLIHDPTLNKLKKVYLFFSIVSKDYNFGIFSPFLFRKIFLPAFINRIKKSKIIEKKNE